MTSSAQLHSSLSLCLRRRFSVNACAKNLVNRKSHLTPDTIEDVAYLYSEYKNLSKKLVEAKQRQNWLGNKIMEAI
ncbi:Serine--tRNA ligase, mitochondrial [Puccinia graminis f. sp. tritici]|uniref:Serine--tRNA ligase, mitochondrial n=1 Tax=Puccinia graminis f. sp. tritici TaxID=56615 RepID=A0A5B0R6F6_PUCGR|nr:Serine--tRNA ligase, mitochondrial [Puccinia graminis f. sp. tritici]